MTKTCISCEADISARGPKAQRCVPCAKNHSREYNRGWHATNVEYRRRYARDLRSKEPRHGLLNHAKARAKTAGVLCTITIHDIEIPPTCPLLGIPLRRGVRQKHDGSPSVDRINPGGGYTPDNVWVVSNRANRIKNDATLAELEMIALALRKKLEE